MDITFKILEKDAIESIIPLVKKLNNDKISEDLLKKRFSEMVVQNYECAIVLDGNKIIGVSGLWFCTRHYSGKSVEPDHVYIEEAYRGKGIGKQFFKWIYDYVKSKGYETIELNAYVSNSPSHKFYLNEGFKILGFHFLKSL